MAKQHADTSTSNSGLLGVHRRGNTQYSACVPVCLEGGKSVFEMTIHSYWKTAIKA